MWSSFPEPAAAPVWTAYLNKLTYRGSRQRSQSCPMCRLFRKPVSRGSPLTNSLAWSSQRGRRQPLSALTLKADIPKHSGKVSFGQGAEVQGGAMAMAGPVVQLFGVSIG